MYQDDNKDLFISSSCADIFWKSLGFGLTVTGMMTWDLMKLIDFISTVPYCDADRIWSAGLSGGGLQTLWIAAMDDRIKGAIISGYFFGYRDTLMKMLCCPCNYVPGLWEVADIGDVAALICPRPLLIETGDADSLNGERGLVNTTEQANIVREAYKLMNSENKFFNHIFKGEHLWCGEEAYPFIKKWI